MVQNGYHGKPMWHPTCIMWHAGYLIVSAINPINLCSRNVVISTPLYIWCNPYRGLYLYMLACSCFNVFEYYWDAIFIWCQYIIDLYEIGCLTRNNFDCELFLKHILLPRCVSQVVFRLLHVVCHYISCRISQTTSNRMDENQSC